MSPKRADLGPRSIIALALVTLGCLGIPEAGARLLLLESPLDAHVPLGPDSRRMEFGSETFGADKWMGQRLHFRYAGSRGGGLTWSLTLPWLYSSYANGGRSGRDNLQVGGAVGLVGAASRRVRLAGDFWLPFSDDSLYPLAQRRAFARVALLGRLGAEPGGMSLACAYRREAVGLGPEVEGPAWSEQIQGELALDRAFGAGLAVSLRGGISHAFDESLTWVEAGAGLSLRWSEDWSAELRGLVGLGAQAEPDRHDYALRLVLRRDRPLPVEEPAAADPQPPASSP